MNDEKYLLLCYFVVTGKTVPFSNMMKKNINVEPIITVLSVVKREDERRLLDCDGEVKNGWSVFRKNNFKKYIKKRNQLSQH